MYAFVAAGGGSGPLYTLLGLEAFTVSAIEASTIKTLR